MYKTIAPISPVSIVSSVVTGLDEPTIKFSSRRRKQ